MHIKVTPSATASQTVAHVEIDGHRYDVPKIGMPGNLPPLVRLAAETFWKGGAEVAKDYGVYLVEN